MSLKTQLTDDMKTAMKAGDKERLGVVRLILAALKQREVDERIEITDVVVLVVLEKMLKQRKDSISQFEAAGRDDLAQIEKMESAIIQTYLPQPLGAEEVQALVAQAIADTGADGPQAMGKVIAALKPQLAGRADMGVVSGLVKAALAAK
ncbi:MAG TPA: GatB/YqeY domain-containing protein [Arenimonas sp.]|nr:GatB/YqeY domain-containing protein [Arenimonas sp.]